jgi:hypothetical protein
VVSAGAGAVLDTLFFCLCNPGDGVLIPAPYYPAFDNDLQVCVYSSACYLSVPRVCPAFDNDLQVRVYSSVCHLSVRRACPAIDSDLQAGWGNLCLSTTMDARNCAS